MPNKPNEPNCPIKAGRIKKLQKKLRKEENDLKYSEFKKLSDKASRKLGAKLVPTKNLVENLRIIKDKDEAKKIRRAC